MKRTIVYLLLLVVVIGSIYIAFEPNLSSIRVDSGWDSSYDSGSSSDWSSSGSDWGSSSSSYSSSSSADITEIPLYLLIVSDVFVSFIFIFLSVISWLDKDKWKTVVIGIIVKCIVVSLLIVFVSRYFFYPSIILSFSALLYGIFKGEKKRSNSVRRSTINSYNDVSLDDLKLVGIDDIEVLKEKLYQVFIDVQNAWMDFDYDKLSRLCSNELYNSYKSDLEVLKLKNGKNIMSDFNRLDIKVYKVNNSKDKCILDVYLRVRFHDYVINTSNDKVIRGNKNQVHDNSYLLKYSKKDVIIDKCPSCGASINKGDIKCSHCGNSIIDNNDEWVLIQKGRV